MLASRAARSRLSPGACSFTGHVGLNEVRFYGHVSRRVRLRPRAYKLVIRAAVTGEPSASKTLSFRVVK
jgi:hypothetical protein